MTMTEQQTGQLRDIEPQPYRQMTAAEVRYSAERKLQLGGLASEAAFLDALPNNVRDRYMHEYSGFYVESFGD
mgnify:CR=1 FL=1